MAANNDIGEIMVRNHPEARGETRFVVVVRWHGGATRAKRLVVRQGEEQGQAAAMVRALEECFPPKPD